jgi:hypothetical protein
LQCGAKRNESVVPKVNNKISLNIQRYPLEWIPNWNFPLPNSQQPFNVLWKKFLSP